MINIIKAKSEKILIEPNKERPTTPVLKEIVCSEPSNGEIKLKQNANNNNNTNSIKKPRTTLNRFFFSSLKKDGKIKGNTSNEIYDANKNLEAPNI